MVRWDNSCARADVALRSVLRRLRQETGEGVISAAIVVLIMAILGAAMWAVFNDVFTDATNTVSDRVGEIGG